MKKLLLTAMLVGTFGLTYAQSDYYNDYRRSITDINWASVITDLVLSQTQANQIYVLNDRYHDYNSWNRVYVNNPDRWREDRYFELERILGPDKYLKFKNKYYKGQNPVAVYNRNKNNNKKYKQGNKKVYIYKEKGNGHHH
ncbi:hypothetical protein [Chryseobacterium geocarposphaerae]|uniref:Uncharacterized protein n=1 Tax=Chryseobacterium geocarposphaerae TaxID=1416776 RepID=A0A2M9C8S8_9FLAO|nr:hypothetical protein [Chryseobacterium geocarposphaerae]PJJ67216.1 hypothetical protein CLV73_1218 [Chryseobacterium geocarposphaerae]